MKTTKYNKLVRDFIPQTIERDDKQAIYKTVTDRHELSEYLHAKLNEDVSEYNESHELEELADIMEVIYGIVYNKGYGIHYLHSIVEDKLARVGGFRDGIVLLEVNEFNDDDKCKRFDLVYKREEIKKMTLSEIESELGYKVEIVG